MFYNDFVKFAKIPLITKGIHVEPNKKMLTPDDIANYLAVTPQTVTNLIREGDLPGIKVGKQWRVDPDQFQRYLQHGGTPTYREYVDLMAQEYSFNPSDNDE